MIFLVLLLLSALFISCVAAFFSITGLMATFPGAVLGAALMGLSMEIGKLMSVSFTYRFWHKLNLFIRGVLISFVFVLSIVTSIGIFGYLSRANVQGIQGLNVGTDQIAIVDTRIQTEQQNIMMQQTLLKQLDNPVNILLEDTSKTERAIRLRSTQRRERATAAAAIDSSSRTIAALQQEKASLNVGQQQVETDVGPLKYLSQIIFGTDTISTIQKAVRLLILLLISVFDPLAIMLVFAANMQIKEMKESGLAKRGKLANLAIDEKIAAPVVEIPVEEVPIALTTTTTKPPEDHPRHPDYLELHHPS